MKKIFSILVLLSLMFPQVILTAEFNPNYIISDEEMQSWQSMNISDIQAFLEEKNGYISRLKSDDWEGTRRKTSDIIYRASREHKINPKYILVTLQKEQSLVTDKDPSQKQLDWATGYGVCDSCNMSDPNIQKYKGFGVQVDRSAGIMRWYYDNMDSKNWINKKGETIKIDGQKIKLASDATGFLYNYTPHIHGNKNFWNLWQEWFDQVYPDGTLIKANGESDVYLIQNGQKRKFENMTSLITRYDPKMIVSIPKSELSRYASGKNISLPNYSIVKQGSKYYLLDYDYKRPFASYEVVQKLGYHPDEIIDVTSSDLNEYTNGTTITAESQYVLGRLIQVKENNEIYYLQDNMYYPVYDEEIARVNYPNLILEKVNVSELKGFDLGDPILFKDGTIFGIEGRNKIYVVEKGKKRHITSEDVYNSLGFDWSNIVWVNQFAGMAHKTGSPISVKLLSTTTNTASPNEDTSIKLEEKSNNINESIENTQKQEQIDPVDYMLRTPADQVSFVGPQFDTEMETYLVADYETGKILAGKNIDFKRPMASLTKVMTGYQLLIDGLGLNYTTTYNPPIHRSSYHMYRIATGEKVKNSNLMDAMLVSSLNTPSRMLVNSKGNNEDEFISRMNKQVKAWGLNNTTFTDTSGFDIGNQTTAHDYLTIFSKASKNATMKNYLGKSSYRYSELIDKDGKPNHFDNNSNKLIGESGLPYKILASKTGFLYKSGTCLVMLVERNIDGKKLVIITMGNPDFGKNTRFNEPRIFTEWAINL